MSSKHFFSAYDVEEGTSLDIVLTSTTGALDQDHAIAEKRGDEGRHLLLHPRLYASWPLQHHLYHQVRQDRDHQDRRPAVLNVIHIAY